MAFPVSLPDDGLIDIVAQSTVSCVNTPACAVTLNFDRQTFQGLMSLHRSEALREVNCIGTIVYVFSLYLFISVLPFESLIVAIQLHYLKANAYRIKPLSKKGNLSIDGELYPFDPFQVEVLPGLATLLSSHGSYNAPFSEPANKR